MNFFSDVGKISLVNFGQFRNTVEQKANRFENTVEPLKANVCFFQEYSGAN